MDEILIPTPAVSRPPAERPGSPVPRRPDARGARRLGAQLEAYSDTGVAPRGMDARRGRRGHWDVSSRSPTGGLAISRARRAGGPDRRTAAEATKAARHAAAGGDCSAGLW